MSVTAEIEAQILRYYHVENGVLVQLRANYARIIT